MRQAITRELLVVMAVVSVAMMAMALLGPVMPLYLASVGMTPQVIGLIMAAGTMGMVLGESAGGWLADRAGIRAPMLIGTFLSAPLLVVIIFAQGAAPLFATFFLWGIVRSAAFGPGRGYIGTHVPPAYRGTIMAMYATALAGTRSLGAFGSGFVADLWGFRWDFILAIAISLIGGILVLVGLRRLPARRDIASPTVAGPVSNVPIYRNRAFVIQSVIAALYFTVIGVGPFLSLLATDLGLAKTQVGLLFTIGAGANALLLIPMGRLADHKSKRGMMVIGLLISSAAMAGIAFSSSFGQLALFQVVSSVGAAMFGPAAVSLLSENVPRHRQSTAMGVYGGCEDFGMIIGSAVGGIVWGAMGATATFMLVGGASTMVAAVMSFTLLKKAPPGASGRRAPR